MVAHERGENNLSRASSPFPIKQDDHQPSGAPPDPDSKASAAADELTLLLPKDQACQSGSVSHIKPSPIHAILNEFYLLFKSSLPVILAYTLQNSLQTISVVIVGRLSPEALATAAFSYMFAMATGWLIALGGTTAIDTLASATFTGGHDPKDLGVILQRSFLVLAGFYVPVVVLWFCSEPVFIALGQEAWLAHDASRFLMVLAPGGLGYIYFECMKKFLQAQEIMRPGTYVLLLTSPTNALLNYLFIYKLELGLLGAPFATSISYWLSFIVLLLYGYYRTAARRSFAPLSIRLASSNILTFSKLAVLGVIHIGTEWWAFEIVTLVAGRLGTIPLAAQSVISTADQVMNTIPFGVGVAASARVGNLLGLRNAPGARRAAHAAAWLSMVLGALVLAALMSSKNAFGRLFNSDERVVSLVADVIPYVALFQIADGLNGSCGGSLRGQGRQHVGATVNLVSYYCGALPLGIWLAFHGWGLKGLWVGQCVALYLVGFAEWGIVGWSNWEKEVDRAFERMDKGSGNTEDARRDEGNGHV